MRNFHSRDISSHKYNYLELPTTVLTIHIHSNTGSQILNRTSYIQFVLSSFLLPSSVLLIVPRACLFLVLSLRVTPPIHRSMFVLLTSIRDSCYFIVADVSALHHWPDHCFVDLWYSCVGCCLSESVVHVLSVVHVCARCFSFVGCCLCTGVGHLECTSSKI